MLLSRRLRKQSARMEQLFRENLRSRDIEAQVNGEACPSYADKLTARDLHIADLTVPEDSRMAGKTLKELRWGQTFGILVCSILRGRQRINIPGGSTMIFPGDRLQAIGSDEQLTAFGQELRNDVLPEDAEIEKRAMQLRKMVLRKGNTLIGKTVAESGIREQYDCMIVGIEEGQKDLTTINPNHSFTEGDVLWVVGEEDSLRSLSAAIQPPVKNG